MRKLNIMMIGISLVLIVLLGVVVSYSLWNISVSQDKVNTAMTSCFDITYSSESNAINLEKQYPISDEAGSKLTPYTFKITNNCDINAYYKINLETLNTSNIDTRFIKTSLNNTNPQVINRYNETEVSLKNGKVANTLKSGYLPVGGSIYFDLRVWLDYYTTINDIKNDGTDKWVGKIVVISSPVTEDEINSVCQSSGGDLIDGGECRKYYVKVNNFVNFKSIKFGNEETKINGIYDDLTNIWNVNYSGDNKWFGVFIVPVKEKVNHLIYGRLKATGIATSFRVEFCGYNSGTGYCYYPTKIDMNNFGNNEYSYYFNLSKVIDEGKILSYNRYLIYHGYGDVKDDEISETYTIEKYSSIDLTLMFGEGNEPSREWCDKYLDRYVEYNLEGTLIPIKEIGEPIKTSYYDVINMID